MTSPAPDERRSEWERAASDVAIDQLDHARLLVDASDWGAARRILRKLRRSDDAEIAQAARLLLARLNPDAMAWGLMLTALVLLGVVLAAVY